MQDRTLLALRYETLLVRTSGYALKGGLVAVDQVDLGSLPSEFNSGMMVIQAKISLLCFTDTLVSFPGSGHLFLQQYVRQWQPLLACCFSWVFANKAPAWTPSASALISAVNTVTMMMYTVQLMYFYE